VTGNVALDPTQDIVPNCLDNNLESSDKESLPSSHQATPGGEGNMEDMEPEQSSPDQGDIMTEVSDSSEDEFQPSKVPANKKLPPTRQDPIMKLGESSSRITYGSDLPSEFNMSSPSSVSKLNYLDHLQKDACDEENKTQLKMLSVVQQLIQVSCCFMHLAFITCRASLSVIRFHCSNMLTITASFPNVLLEDA